MKHDGKLSEYKKNIWTASEAKQHQVDTRQEQLHENFVKFHYLFFLSKKEITITPLEEFVNFCDKWDRSTVTAVT